jgi:hypothetical protein
MATALVAAVLCIAASLSMTAMFSVVASRSQVGFAPRPVPD